MPSKSSAPAPLRLMRRWHEGIASWVALVGRAFWRGVVGFYNSDDMTHAASVSYYALLSLFPSFLLIFSLLGQFAVDESRRMAIIDFLLRYFPTRLDFLTRQLDALRNTRVPLGIGGGVALTWAALGVFSAVSTAVNHAWRVEQPRSYLKHKLFSLLMMLAAGLILVIALAIVSAVQFLQAAYAADLAVRAPSAGMLGPLFVPWASTLMLILVVGFVLYFVPNTKVRFRDVWPGAVVTGLMWRATLVGFTFYLRDMGRFSMIHGSIAAVIVFLVWVYSCAVVLLYGVEFTAAYARLRRQRLDEARVP